MPIRTSTLERDGYRYLVVVEENETLASAVAQLRQKGYHFDEAYLIISRLNGQHGAVLFPTLDKFLALTGWRGPEQPLSTVPIRPADRVVDSRTPQSGKEILDWVALNPESKVIVVDDTKIVGLFTSPNRSRPSGWVEDHSLTDLHGPLSRLYDDPRTYRPRQEPPTCPNCHVSNFFEFTPRTQVYACPNCRHRVSLP